MTAATLTTPIVSPDTAPSRAVEAAIAPVVALTSPLRSDDRRLPWPNQQRAGLEGVSVLNPASTAALIASGRLALEAEDELSCVWGCVAGQTDLVAALLDCWSWN